MICKRDVCAAVTMQRLLAGAFCLLVLVAVEVTGWSAETAEPPIDLGPLTDAVNRQGCSAGGAYKTVGGVPCWTVPADAGGSDPDHVLRSMGDRLREKTLQMSLQARKEDAACSRGAASTLAGGTSVGPSTPEEVARTILKSALQDASTMQLPVGTMLSIPGITQVQYEYKGLANGPELRTFRINGRLQGDLDKKPELVLRMDGEVEGDRNLPLEFSVNYKKSRSTFPAWSPFLDAPADIKLEFTRQGLETLSSVARFEKKGYQRNGVKPWHEYEYFWHAERVGARSADIVKSRGKDSNEYAEYPFSGEWVGVAWGSETRFKQTRRGFVAQFSPAAASAMKPDVSSEGVIMSINVKHQSAFYFNVDFNGNVTGRGVIVYSLDPNLCAVAVLTRQVNERINMLQHMPAFYTASAELAKLVTARFMTKWGPAPRTITESMDKAIGQLPRIQPPAGKAAVEKFVAGNPALKKAKNMAFADLDVSYYPKVRLWGPSGADAFEGIPNVAPPTPKVKIEIKATGETNEVYTGAFRDQVRGGRVGWFDDESVWVERSANGWNSAAPVDKNGKPIVPFVRTDDSEIRILDFLARSLPKDAKGTIKLYTTKPPCRSCAGVIEKFYHLFPDVLLVVTYGG